MPKQAAFLVFFVALSLFIPKLTLATHTSPQNYFYSLWQKILSNLVIPTLAPQPSPITITPNPTQNPTPTPTPTITPTASLKPTSTPNPTQRPSSIPTTDIKTFIIAAINNYRKTEGLSEVKVDPYTCNFAKVRAKEISTNFNHDGFRNKISSSSLPYPNYSLVTENIAQISNYQSVVNMWINSSGHAENMRKDTPFVCVENYLDYYAYEGWRP